MPSPSRTTACLALLLLCTASLAAGRMLRIHNGIPADGAASAQLGFVVAFYENPTTSEEALTMTPFCTGTLLSSNVVLTAAHCVYDGGEFYRDVSVRIEGEGDRLFSVVESIIPTGYAKLAQEVDTEVERYDVAVVQLAEHATTAPVAGLVSASYEPAVGQELMIAGYGDEDQTASGDRDGVTTTNTLHYANVLYMADKCPRLLPGTLCAGGPANTCAGDSGGPLLAQGDAGLWYLLGVTSYGPRCGNGAATGALEWSVFTDVRAYDINSMIAALP